MNLKIHFFLFLFSSLLNINFSFSRHKATTWSVNLEEAQKVFIENKGQFDGKNIPDGSGAILYGVRYGGVDIYFTSTGMTYRRINSIRQPGDEGEKAVASPKEPGVEKKTKHAKVDTFYMTMHWGGINPEASIISEKKVNHYFTYSDLDDPNGKSSIRAGGFKKIRYKNIYPNTDVEFTFPENKPGIKYTIILHPGADPGAIQMQYDDAVNLLADAEGNIRIKSLFGEFVDHAPVTYENGEKINSFFVVNNNSVSFQVKRFNSNKTISIDPWTTTPTFTGTNKAYDIDWDYMGNIYIYGGESPFQLIKLDNTGAFQWIYNSTVFANNEDCYGDFATDRNTGSSYLCQAWNDGSQTQMLKVNTSGNQVALFGGNSDINEMWRMVYNSCTHQGVIGCGNTNSPYQAATFDTNLVSIIPVNILSTAETFHDIALLAIDDTNCYIATAHSAFVNPMTFDNVLLKCPLPTLLPIAYMVPDGHNFNEVSSIKYYPTYPSNTSNGFNGMAKGKYLYTYDGATLRKWNPVSGTLVNTVVISADSFACGGIAVDNCENIFLGTTSGVNQYDSSLAFVTSATTSGEVYDLALGIAGEVIACGNGFVSALSLYSPCVPASSITLTTNTIDATCQGNDGTASVSVSGGTPPFNYLWNPGGQTTSTAYALAPGTYTIRVMEGNSISCSNSGFQIDTVIITGSSGFTGQSHNITNVNCSNDGAITISVSGGTAPFTYTWSPSSGGQTGSTVTGLATGTYHVTVQDASGCRTIDSMTVTSAPNSLTVSYYKQNIACDSLWTGGGYILLNVTNGDQPYTYLWSTGETTGELWNILSSGTYYVTVSDANGCQAVSGIQINQPASFWYISSIEVSGACSGNNGKLIIRLGNGSLYSISSFIYDSLFTIWIPGDTLYTGLSPGNYICHINDDKSCKDTSFAFTITNAALTLNSLQTDPSCSGSGDGMIWVSSLSGTPPFTYNWSGGGSDSLSTGLDSGTYTVSVTDSAGCSSVKTFILSEPAPVSVSFNVTNTLCGLNEGVVSVSATGGTGSYSWSWSTGDTLQSAANLAAGIYVVTVSDDNNCSISDTALVTGIGTSMINLDIIINETCFGGSNGAVIISMNGGTFPFTYTWSNGASNEDIYGIKSGTYTITVTEGSGCVAMDTFTVAEPDSLEILSGAMNATCKGADGSAWVTVSGGTPGYTFLWNTNSTNDTIINMNSGEYFITVSDFNNCTEVASVTIVVSGKPTVNIENITNVSCKGGSDGSASLTVNGGTLPYSFLWSNGSSLSSINNLPASIYSITVTDSLGCIVYADTVIVEPAKIEVTITTDPAGCTGGGTAAVAAAGGAGTYSYMWSNGNTQSTIYNLQSTIYSVTVTDGNGCKVSDTATVALNDSIVAIIEGIGEICPGQQNQLTASGGGTYSWNTGATTATLTVAPDVTTLYSVVANLGSCSDSALFNVIVFPAVGVSVRDTVVYAGDMALLSAFLTGGTSPFTYTWIPGNQNTPDIMVNPLSASNYLVMVGDANGCTSYDSVLVNVIPCDAEVFVPNAFAPGCKCPDNTLKVYSDCIETMEFFIYDRWGEKVFESSNPSKGWDGTYKGKPMNPAAYVYYLKFTTINAPGEKKVLEGNINLLR